MIILCIFRENVWAYTETIELVDLPEKKLRNTTSKSNSNAKFHRRKTYEFVQVSLDRIYGSKTDK